MEFRTFQKQWGAEFISDDVVRFRVWAEGQKELTLRLAAADVPMTAAGDGWFQADVSGVTHGAEYQFVLQDGMTVPDPASRAQKGDVNGPSIVIDPQRYQPVNRDWAGRPWEETVIYELHIGTFTPEGTFRAAIDKLPYLAELGITQLEVMPVSQFGGSRGWGYDGVLLYAPHSAYGTPEDFHAFIDAAHGLGLSVVLDIVLNHFGPEGNYLPLLSPAFFDAQRMTPWGNGIAYEREPVRQYITDAPLYWLTEYRLDGLRFDAIDQIKDSSETHILEEIAAKIREAIPHRHVHLTTEDSRNVIFLHPRDEQGNTPLFTAEWNDDFHNAAHVFATGETHAYYQDFAFEPEKKFARALAEGFVYQGEISLQTGESRGWSARRSRRSSSSILFRTTIRPGIAPRASGLSPWPVPTRRGCCLPRCCFPHIPLLFMGEEFGETHPFLFFTDFHGDLAKAVREGRAKEFTGHAGHDETVPDPNDVNTFIRSKLDWNKLPPTKAKRGCASRAIC
jgi:malto-oligosyltrehalose trehalohydrolase